MAPPPLSIVTNASANDLERLQLVIPHWLSVFGKHLSELVIVLDNQEATGRIATLHARPNDQPFGARLATVRDAIYAMCRADPRIVLHNVPQGPERADLIGRWFGDSRLAIDRCQMGTPILPFVAAFDAARHAIVLRADCDMLFYENGWLAAATEMLTTGIVDLVEPPRCGGTAASDDKVSTRVLMLAQPAWRSRVLPLRPARLDPARRLHRWVHGRPTWLALEQMFEVERQAGRLRYVMLSPELGCSLHVARREEAALGIMPSVRSAVESGRIPEAQIEHGHNFALQAWAPRGTTPES